VELIAEASPQDGATAYQRSLNSAVRGLWNGVIALDDFYWSFGSSIERGLTNAWTMGAAAGGITPDEFTPEEQAQLRRHILSDRMYMSGFANDIETGSKANGGKLSPLLNRVGVWVNHWWEVYGLAQAMAQKDQKMMFVRVFPTKKPCRSCSGLEGRVYRNSVWLANDCVPPSRRTDCGGWRCGHRLVPTDARVTPGRFPAGLLRS
jgi:hypothetical protein